MKEPSITEQLFLPVPPNSSFSLFTCTESKHHLRVLCKCHDDINLEEADHLLRTALHLQQTGQFHFPLLPPRFETGSRSFRAFKLTFRWKLEGEDYLSVLRPCWDMSFPPRTATYRKVKTIIKEKALPYERTVNVHEGVSNTLSVPVVIKTYICANVGAAASSLEEVFIQSPFKHANICQLYDLCIYQSKRKIKVGLVLERLQMDLEYEAECRVHRQQGYEEAELWGLLVQAVEGLLHIKEKVIITQNIAHRDIKPSNMLTDGIGNLKIADFGSCWIKVDKLVTSKPQGTPAYLSPEAKSTQMYNLASYYAPFNSDIYSLGLTFLQLALGRLPEASKFILNCRIGDPGWEGKTAELRNVIKEEVKMLEFSQQFKDLLLDMLEIQPSNRPELGVILQIAKPRDTLGPARDYCRRYRYQEAVSLYKDIWPGFCNKKASLDIGLEFAEVLYMRLSQATEAGTVLTQVAALARDEISSKFVKYEQACVLFFLEKYEESIRRYEELIEECDEDLRTASWFYICEAQWMLGNEAALQAMNPIHSSVKNELKTAVEWHYKALIAQIRKDWEAANALRTDISVTAVNTTRFPFALFKAINLLEWGNLLTNQGARERALEKYSKAEDILTLEFPKNLFTAINAIQMGNLLRNLRRKEDAILKYISANEILSVFYQESINYCTNLVQWGLSLDDASAAIDKHRAASKALTRYPNAFVTGANLHHWGVLLRKAGKEKEAAEKFKKAGIILAGFDDPLKAINLTEWGRVLNAMDNWPEASEKFRQADDFLSIYFPNSPETAYNLIQWGIALTYMRQWPEASAKMQAGKAIFAQCPERSYSEVGSVKEWGEMPGVILEWAGAAERVKTLENEGNEHAIEQANASVDLEDFLIL